MNDTRLDQIAALAEDARVLAEEIHDEIAVDSNEQYVLSSLHDWLALAVRYARSLKDC